MDKIVKDHSTGTSLKICAFSGNNSTRIRQILSDNYHNVEDIPFEDEKYAYQISNVVWKQNDLSTFANHIWETTNSKLRQNNFWLNKVQRENGFAMASKEQSEKFKSIIRIVNHVDGFRSITTKTGILNQLRNYY